MVPRTFGLRLSGVFSGGKIWDIENEDFQGVEIFTPSGQTRKDHIIKLDTAKEMAMLERNEKGKQVRYRRRKAARLQSMGRNLQYTSGRIARWHT